MNSIEEFLLRQGQVRVSLKDRRLVTLAADGKTLVVEEKEPVGNDLAFAKPVSVDEAGEQR